MDSVATDDFSGGVCAAELLAQWAGARARFAVLAGPEDDKRSVARAAGFCTRLPRAAVTWSAFWFYEDGRSAAADVMAGRPAAVFCGNDRLAEGLIDHCREAGGRAPFLMGFDDAPVAERLDFSTVAVPWREIAEGAVAVVKKRLRGDTGAAARQVFSPRPVVRRPRAL